MEAVIRKWGNSPALRIPTSAMRDAGYQLEQRVELVVSRGRIVIQPSERAAYDLDALVNGINAANAHGEVDFGCWRLRVSAQIWLRDRVLMDGSAES